MWGIVLNWTVSLERWSQANYQVCKIIDKTNKIFDKIAMTAVTDQLQLF